MKFKNFKSNLKFIIFSILLLPIILHIYGGLFDLLFQGYFYIIIIVIFIMVNFIEINKRIVFINTKEYIIFLLFLISIYIDTFIYNIHVLKDTIKYTLYVIFYFYVLQHHFAYRIYYKYFVRFIAFIMAMEIVFYLIFLNFPEQLILFQKNKLSLLFDSSPFITREDWNYSLPFYLIVYPIDYIQNGILGLPRFFGFSNEPTLLVCVLLPLLLIAYNERETFSLVIIFIAFLLASSYAGLFILFLGILYYTFFRFRKFITIAFIAFIGFILFTLYNTNINFSSPRLEVYSNLILNIFQMKISLFSSSFDEELKLPSAILHFIIEYGLIPSFFLLLILLYKLKQSIKLNKILFVFTLVSILMLNKSGEPLSLLLLFYFNYINVYYNLKQRYNKCVE